VTNGNIKYHDRRIPYPGYKELGIGSFPSLPVPNITQEFNLKPGIFSSGGSFTFDHGDSIQFEENEAVVKDMETAAIAEVCQLRKVKMFAIRGITDILENPTQGDEFLVNLGMVTKKVGDIMNEIIRSLIGKDISDL